MMSIEPRNEPRMLRWFRRTYPSYNLQPLLLKRYRELEEARAFNNWLGERRQAQEGQRHLDDVSRLTEAVHRQVPQLRYARAEHRGVERAAGEVAQQWPCSSQATSTWTILCSPARTPTPAPAAHAPASRGRLPHSRRGHGRGRAASEVPRVRRNPLC